MRLLSNDSLILPETLGNLRILDLSWNHIDSLPYFEFHLLSNMEVLDLSWNQLYDLNIKLPKSPAFKMLDISGNKLTYLSANITLQLEAYNYLEVNIQNNLFICGCETLHFVHWVQSTAVNLTGRDALYCFTDRGRLLITKINFHKLYSDCHPWTAVQVGLISGSLVVCFFGLLMSAVFIYRRRWKIRYFWYRRRLRRQRAQQQRNDNYVYDAFVSFCDESQDVKDWVQTNLEMELRDKRGLRLFIPQLDVLPCERLLQEIDEGMGKCRKTIVILSPEYLEDWRCMYEVNGAHTTMVSEDRDAVVLVKLQPLPIIGLPRTLTNLMEMRGCLTWTENPVGQEVFWARLETALLSSFGNPIND